MEFITRDYICSKEMFEEARAYQKQLAEWGKHYDTYEAIVIKEDEEYCKTHPEPKDRWSSEHLAWNRARPIRTSISEFELPKVARHHNIVYSIMRGRIYSQIENKVHENNEPQLWRIRELLKKYNIDEQAFMKVAKDAVFK